MNVETGSKLRFRAIWISDIHLGTHGCKAELLAEGPNRASQ